MEFIQHNLLLVITAVGSGAMLLWSFLGKRAAGINQINTLEATRLMNEDALMLDVREDNEWAVGHIPNAKHVRLGQLSDQLSTLEKFKEKPIVVYCRSGNRSATACAMLKKAGFAKANNLAGGIIAWEQAHLPITRK
jgi:rhodanese-related sulfurtransferase